LQRLIVHIDRGFHLGPRITEMAGLVERSRSHVSETFRRYVGQSAKRFVIERQLRAARELLLSTTLRSRRSRRKVGLTDPSRFEAVQSSRGPLTPGISAAEWALFIAPKASRHLTQPVLPRK
jgi:AraC-like DNA-binding protein